MPKDLLLWITPAGSAPAGMAEAAPTGLAVHHVAAEQLESEVRELLVAGGNPLAILIGEPLTDLLAVAREAYRLLPMVQIVFLVEGDRQTSLQHRLAMAPRIGTNWSLGPTSGETLTQFLEDAARATRRRLHHRTTLDRVRVSLAAPPPPADSPDFRRLVLSDRHLGSILTHASDAIFSTDIHGVIRSWNRGAEQSLGWPERDVLGRSVSTLDAEADAAPILELIGAMAAGTPEIRCERHLRRSDGAAIASEISFAPVRDERGALLGVSVIARDVTERRKAAAAIQQQKELLHATLTSIGDGMVATDADGRVTFLNPVAEHLTGWTLAEARGQPLTVIFHIVNEDTRAHVDNPALRALRDGCIVGLANHTILIAKDGTERPIDDSAAPIRDEQGQVVGCVLVFRDITDRKRAESALQENERRFRALVEQVEDYAIFMTDSTGRATSWNEGVKKVLGFEEAEFVGQDIVHAIFTPEDQASGVADSELQEAAETGRAGDDRWMQRKDGTKFFAAGVTTGLHDETGKLIGFMKVMRDQTAQKRLEDELRQVAADLSESDRRKTEFLATLGHELRNPLAPIRTGLELMKLMSHDPATLEETRSMMERQTQQLVRLIDDLLDVSRITQGKLQLRTCRVSLADVVQSAVEASSPFVGEAGHQLTVALPAETVYLNADPNRLAQVLSNLLNNSAKYTPEGGRIRITAQRQGSDVVVTVHDNGLGIPADMQTRIFEMFTQIDRPLERGYKGLGIGLTLVKRIVEMHGGMIEVQSAGEGKGSEFSVRLPIMPDAFKKDPKPASNEAEVKPMRLRILVVDDNRAAADMLGMVVEMLGNEVRTAYDGLQGIEAAAAFRPDVVLMDLGMPKMNGYEAARIIREQEWGKPIVLVALTGWGQDDDRRRTKDAGFDHHLVKPAEPEALQLLLAALKPESRS